MGVVLWDQSLWLHTLTLLLSVLLVDLRSGASAPLTHLFLHTLKTLVQLVPLQQARQLVLGKVSWSLTGSVRRNQRWRVWRWVIVRGNESKKYLWRFVVHGPTSFGKFFHIFQYLMFHFRRQAGKLLWVDVHWISSSRRFSLKCRRTFCITSLHHTARIRSGFKNKQGRFIIEVMNQVQTQTIQSYIHVIHVMLYLSMRLFYLIHVKTVSHLLILDLFLFFLFRTTGATHEHKVLCMK